MKIEIYHVNGEITRGIDCLCFEWHDGCLFVYYTWQQYIDQLPDQFDTVLSYKVWDDRLNENDSGKVTHADSLGVTEDTTEWEYTGRQFTNREVKDESN